MPYSKNPKCTNNVHHIFRILSAEMISISLNLYTFQPKFRLIFVYYYLLHRILLCEFPRNCSIWIKINIKIVSPKNDIVYFKLNVGNFNVISQQRKIVGFFLCTEICDNNSSIVESNFIFSVYLYSIFNCVWILLNQNVFFAVPTNKCNQNSSIEMMDQTICGPIYIYSVRNTIFPCDFNKAKPYQNFWNPR